jgi:AraC-like DNA-binding protein
MPNSIADTPRFAPSDIAFVLDTGQPVLAHGRDLAAETGIEPHRHPRGQLLWAAEGVLRVTSEDAVWIVPSSHAVWIPGGVFHHMVTETPARTRNLYIDPAYPVRVRDTGCAMLLLTPLMREIILRLAADRPMEDPDGLRRLGLVAIDEIERLDSAPLNLPAGKDERLRRLIGFLVQNPYDRSPLAELAKNSGASLRTMERLFHAETGMTFRQWRSRLRLLSAVEHLRQGKSSTAIAFSLGFQSASAFVAAFRKTFGRPPQSFLTG